MSWDLYLVPPDAAGDVGAWLEQVADEGHDATEARRHADVILARRPEFELGGPFGDDYELTFAEGSYPLQVGLYGNHAAISVAYWDLGEGATELGEILVEIVTVLGAATGWIAYDPQEDRVVAADEVGRVFSSGHAVGVDFIPDVLSPSEPPKRRRRFGLF